VTAKTVRRLRTLLINLGLVAAFVPAIYYTAVEWLGWEMTRRLAERAGPPNAAAWRADDGPYLNPDNLYWVVEYDCRETDVEITGVVPRCRYWSLVAYDHYTLPLPSHLFDETLRTDADGGYTAVLTTRPTGRPNEIDVSPAPRGAAVVRVGSPDDAEAAGRAAPRVRPAPRE
jgi:hypothetical protein